LKWSEGNLHSFAAAAQHGYTNNHIAIPAGISQFPLYQPGMPDYLAYGALGLVVGHEVTHGFDNVGHQFDNERRLRTWWDEATMDEFITRLNCFADQYFKIAAVLSDGKPLLNETSQQPIYVNGNLTLGENVADAGGLNVAFDAWRERESAAPAPHLPGLEGFTKQQLFFLAAGQVWCSSYSPDTLLHILQSDRHSPYFARILGSTANSRGFMEAFNCKKREPTCEMW